MVLRQQLASLEASIPQRVNDAVTEQLHQAVANKVNALMPTVVQSVVDYITSGAKGPAPMISAGGSNSFMVAPRGEGGAPKILVTPTRTMKVIGRDRPPSLAQRLPQFRRQEPSSTPSQ